MPDLSPQLVHSFPASPHPPVKVWQSFCYLGQKLSLPPAWPVVTASWVTVTLLQTPIECLLSGSLLLPAVRAPQETELSLRKVYRESSWGQRRRERKEAELGGGIN